MRIAAVVMTMISITAHCDIIGGAAASSSVKIVADIIVVVDRFIFTAAAVAIVHHEGDAGKALLFGGRVFHYRYEYGSSKEALPTLLLLLSLFLNNATQLIGDC